MNHNYFSAALLIGILVMGQDLAEIPADLTFSCEGRPYGYYADPATNCQVFHICLGDGDIKWSFLCPNQTIFNQVRRRDDDFAYLVDVMMIFLHKFCDDKLLILNFFDTY